MASEGGILEVFGEMVNDGATNSRRDISKDFERTVWQDIGTIADSHNDPGFFTAVIGYEYSSLPEGDNLHRVVIFVDDADKTNQVLPFTLFDSQNPEHLWAYMQDYENKIGGRVLAIPHNGNLSAGRMFALDDLDGNPLTKDYAERRMRWEPLVETTQLRRGQLSRKIRCCHSVARSLGKEVSAPDDSWRTRSVHRMAKQSIRLCGRLGD